MTIQGAMNELVNLLNADDIPIYYKGGIKKAIETIDDYINDKDDYVKRKTEPQTNVATYRFAEWENGERTCERDGDDYCKDESQTEQAVFSKAILTSNNGVVKVEPQTETKWLQREGEF